MKITYDPEADALYIELRPIAPGTATCRDLAEDIVADYGPDGKLAGIEILDASVVLGDATRHLNIEVAPAPIAKIA
jgi:uncharacterized protein YuzE